MEIIDISNINYEEISIIDIEENDNYTMDFEVNDTHYYTLNNGIISHNSISICSQTSSGIEPVFLPFYKRRRKINPNDKNTKSNFVDDNNDHWEEYIVLHPKFKYWLELNNYNIDDFKNNKNQEEINSIIEKSPYYKATSEDVDWHEKVRMQGEIQKWVDHSISVTINLPNDTTEKTIDELYRTAWKSGCKGLTVYRDGSRSGVLIKDDNKKSITDYLKENNAPKRPKTLECEVVNFVNNKEKWIGFMGVYEEKDKTKYPYELFTGLLESFNVPSYVEKGWIKKAKDKKTNKTRYDFIYLDKDGYEVIMSGLNRAFNRELWNTSKMISAMLRHKIHLPTIINLVDTLQINGSKGVGFPMFGTWQAGVKRTLKKYLKISQVDDESVCPSCGSTNLIRMEGCIKCKDCQWSKC
jgi:ribonucleoside-diphosphate reductase alpha chain